MLVGKRGMAVRRPVAGLSCHRREAASRSGADCRTATMEVARPRPRLLMTPQGSQIVSSAQQVAE